MYSPTYFQDDESWEDLQAAERDDAQVELDLARMERQKLERQLQSLQDPDALTAQLARDLGEDVETVRARIDAVKAAKTATPTAAPSPRAPPGVDANKLDELLDKVPAGDFNAATQALLDAGATIVDPWASSGATRHPRRRPAAQLPSRSTSF